MKISNYRHPTRQDFPGLSPEISRALDVVGRQVRELTQVLQGRASLSENLNCEIRSMEVLDGVDYEVSMTTMSGEPEGAIPIWADNYEIPRVSHFQALSGGRAKVRFEFSTNPTAAKAVRILFVGA